MDSPVTEVQRSAGSLLGLAWGDALGCPIEFWSAALIEHVFGRYETLPSAYPFERLPPDPFIRGHLRPLGLHSDDTQQALALLHVCLAPGGFDVTRWAALLLEGQRAHAWRGFGRNFRGALEKLARGVAPAQSGSPSAGIGAAMRVAPLGAVFRHDHAGLERVVFEATRSTHADARAISFAFAVALACALLIAGRDVSSVREQLPARVAEFEARWLSHEPLELRHCLSSGVRRALDPQHTSLAELRVWLRASPEAQQLMAAELGQLPNHPWVMLGGLHALAVGLWPSAEPAELLADSVRQGGDADTVGAIAGGLLGARFGDAWLPLERLLDATALRAYARALPDGRLPEAAADWLRREAAWTRREHEFQRAQPGA